MLKEETGGIASAYPVSAAGNSEQRGTARSTEPPWPRSLRTPQELCPDMDRARVVLNAPEDTESPGCCNCATGHAQHGGNAQLFLRPELLLPSEALLVFLHSGSIPRAVEATDLSAKKRKKKKPTGCGSTGQKELIEKEGKQ